MSDHTPQAPQSGKDKGPIAGPGMSDDAELVFSDWLASLEYQDVRYHEKVIGVLARQAMVDDAFRAQVLTNPASALKALGSELSLPEGFAVRFLENTDTELNVVLLPRAKTVADYFESIGAQESKNRVALRQRLQSRTAARIPTLFHDDWNLSDAGNDLSLGMIVPPA